MGMSLEKLNEKAQEIKIDLTPETLQKFEQYSSLLREWNQKINLTAIDDPDEIVEKHFWDCLLAYADVKPGKKVCDVGSGAGFPGIVWKLADPSLEVTLLEPTGKKVQFLNEVISSLSLTGIRAENERAEEYARGIHREIFDTVTARAVAPLPILSELCIPLVKVGGTFLAMKGTKGTEEAEDAKHAVTVLGCVLEKSCYETLLSQEERANLIYRKEKSTPREYPRSFAKIKKKPL